MTGPVLAVRGLTVATAGTWNGPPVDLVTDVSFDLNAGELVCVVGESGSGKTVTGHAVLGLAREAGLRVGGSVLFDGDDLVLRGESAVRRLRGRELALVPQDPSSALDPLFTIGAQLAEAVRRREGRSRDVPARVLELLRHVRVPEPEHRVRQYPHELSGGLNQRVLIAMALAGRPRVIVADEPTSALDVTVQAQILALLDEVRRESGTAIVLVTHDISIAAEADRVVVMYAGRVVEEGPSARVLGRPAHPYTAGLAAAVPSLADAPGYRERLTRLPSMPGAVPSPRARPGGCPFRSRCVLAEDRCAEPQRLQPAAADPASNTACWRSAELPVLFDPEELWTRPHREEAG